jgi:hypothetical protein
MTTDVQERPGLSSPNSERGKLQRIALEWLLRKKAEGTIPTSIHFLFYELEQAGLQSKKPLRLDGKPYKRKPDQNLIDAVKHLREHNVIPWDWIVDETRDVSTHFTCTTVAEWSAEMVEVAKISRFPDVPEPVLVCESRAIGGVLERTVAKDYYVTVVPTGGMCCGFLHTKAAPHLKGDVIPLYVGDHDLAGNYIENNTRRELEEAVGHRLERWERLMITDAQCRALQRKGVTPIEKRDERFTDGRPHQAFEAETLGQKEVMRIVRQRLEALVPEPLKSVQEREREQIEQLTAFLEQLK